MTADALAKRLTDRYGEGGLTATQIYREFHIRKSKLPDGLESFTPPGSKRKRYSCGSVARWFTQNRIAEAINFGEI